MAAGTAFSLAARSVCPKESSRLLDQYEIAHWKAVCPHGGSPTHAVGWIVYSSILKSTPSADRHMDPADPEGIGEWTVCECAVVLFAVLIYPPPARRRSFGIRSGCSGKPEMTPDCASAALGRNSRVLTPYRWKSFSCRHPKSEFPRPLHTNPPSPASDTPMLNPLHSGPDPQYPSLIPSREACLPPVRDEKHGALVCL